MTDRKTIYLNTTISFLLIIILFADQAHSERPLIVDEAETIRQGEIQMEAAFDYSKAGRVRNFALPVVLNYGIIDNLEAGIEFGYQFERRSIEDHTEWENGITDLIIASKWKFIDAKDIMVSLAGEIKIPTASESRDLGSGDTDFGLLLIVSKFLGSTEIDLNLGYAFIEHFKGFFDDDALFYGIAVKQDIKGPLKVVGEVFAETPPGSPSDTLAGINGGLQYWISEELVLDAAAGTGFGTESPDLFVTTGFTKLF